MTDDDICGAPCADDTPCQHPAGSCPVASHSNPESENNQGRPSKFTYLRAHETIQAAEMGKSKAGCARAAGVAKSTLEKWLDDGHALGPLHFPNAFRRARSQGEDQWIRDGRAEHGDTSFAKFMLSTSYEYTKTEKREVDATHDHSGDLTQRVELDAATAAAIRDATKPDE